MEFEVSGEVEEGGFGIFVSWLRRSRLRVLDRAYGNGEFTCVEKLRFTM